MTRKPTVSVITSVYNGEKYLREAVESILCQTHTDLEFIVINDGSSDRSEAILKEFSARDKRMRVITKSNEGLTKALNHALRVCRGAYIARFDADDISLPSRLERQVTAIDTDGNLVLVGSEVELITADGIPLGKRGHAHHHEEIRRRLLLGDGGALTHSAVIMRRESLESISGYDERFPVAQDLDLYLRLSEIGRVANLPETLLLWRQHEQSINATQFHLWKDMKRRALENTIVRTGPKNFAAQLLYAPGKPAQHIGFVAAARTATSRGRGISAIRLYLRAIREGKDRWQAFKGLYVLLFRTLRRKLRVP